MSFSSSLLAAFLIVVPVLPGLAGEPPHDERVVEVVELRGPLDQRALDFASNSVEAAAAAGTVEVVVFQLDSPGVVSGEATLEKLIALLTQPPVPIVVWVGPAPAIAYGGALQILAAAPVGAVAPGSQIGYGSPTIAGEAGTEPLVELPDELLESVRTIESGQQIEGLVDLTQPSIRQLLTQDLDGMVVPVADGDRRLSTLVPYTANDGSVGVTNLPTVIRQPGLGDRLLALAIRPETAFFLLVAGLVLAAFEFYALGPGVGAGVAAIGLLLSGYGIATLPVRPWALGSTLVSVLLMSIAHQRGGVLALHGVGIAGLTVAGFRFTDAAPQITPGVAGVVLTVGAAAFFFLLAMPTVARARFSTRTVGRDHLKGRPGKALTDFGPDGEVEVDGARWRAMAHREAGIGAGDAIEVVGVRGWSLEVEPRSREN